MTDAYAAVGDPAHDALAKLVSITCEEAIFGLSAALGNTHDALEDLVKRRKDSHALMLNGQRTLPPDQDNRVLIRERPEQDVAI